MNCKSCNAPDRKIYSHINKPNRELSYVIEGNWISLLKCPQCNQLWCRVQYSHSRSFEYLILWEYSIEDWKNIYNIDNGNSLHQWHEQSINSLWETLPSDEQQAVLFHRERSYECNQIDSLKNTEKINIKELIFMNHLKKMFYDYLDDQLNITDLINFIFDNDEFCNLFSEDDYVDLFNLNSTQLDIRYELRRTLFKYFSAGEYESRLMVNHLNVALNNPDQIPYKLRLFYSLYCSGYTFLEDLVYRWCFWYEVENWEQLTDKQREKWLKGNNQNIITYLQRILDWITNKKIIFLDQYNEFNSLEYIDKRSENEKQPLFKTPVISLKSNTIKTNSQFELVPYNKYKKFNKKFTRSVLISSTFLYSFGMFVSMLIIDAVLSEEIVTMDNVMVILLIFLLCGVLFAMLFILLVVIKELKVVDKIKNAAIDQSKDTKNRYFLIVKCNKRNFASSNVTGIIYITSNSLVFERHVKKGIRKKINLYFNQLISIDIKEFPTNFVGKIVSGLSTKYAIVIETLTKSYIFQIPAININIKETINLIKSQIPHLNNEYKYMRDLINLWDPTQIVLFPKDEYDNETQKVMKIVNSDISMDVMCDAINKLFQNEISCNKEKCMLIVKLYNELITKAEVKENISSVINKLINLWDPIGFHSLEFNSTDYTNIIKNIIAYVNDHKQLLNQECYELYKEEFQEKFIFSVNECDLFCSLLNKLIEIRSNCR